MQLLIGALSVFTVFSMYVFMRVSFAQSEPYMDEIFHIPQARQYCAGNFSKWDPMITTPPGLYLISVGIIKPIAALRETKILTACSTFWLRSINILFAIGNFYLIYALLKKLQNPILDPDGLRLYMTSFALSIFPVLYFFTFLYYTDPGSTFFVLFMYLLHLHDSHILASIMAVVAIFFRQTNIVWVIFVAGLTVRKQLIWWIREKDRTVREDTTDLDLLKASLRILSSCLKTRRGELVRLFVSIVKEVWSYMLVGLGFAIFIYLNDGIVLGAKSYHTACWNFPQIFYFLCMSNFFALFHLITPWKMLDFVVFSVRRYLFVGIFIGIAVILIHNFTYVHEYLLADNRHFPFYIWSKIYRRHEYVKYILIPAYLFCMYSFTSELKHRDVFWKIVFFVCIFMAIVPQKLLEFRYFILPYLIFRLNCRYGTRLALLNEIAVYGLINAATVHLFADKPFKWSNSDDLQRFMW